MKDVEEEFQRIIEYIDGPAELTGPYADWVVTTRDNIKTLDQCFPASSVVDEFCCQLIDNLRNGEHIPNSPGSSNPSCHPEKKP